MLFYHESTLCPSSVVGTTEFPSFQGNFRALTEHLMSSSLCLLHSVELGPGGSLTQDLIRRVNTGEHVSHKTGSASWKTPDNLNPPANF